jgi:hypothetical protein
MAEAGTPLGPRGCQAVAGYCVSEEISGDKSVEELGFPVFRMAFAAARAARCSAGPIHFAGYARLSYASCAGPSTREPSPLELTRPSSVLK